MFKTKQDNRQSLVLQDMGLKNPVLAIVPRDNQKTITRVSSVRVKVRTLGSGLGLGN